MLSPRRTLLPLLALVALAAADEEAAYDGPSPDTGDPYAKKKEKKDDDDLPGGKTRKELAEGKSYCEYDNCYELLGVEPTAGPIPIKRAYRKLAAEWHPDKCPSGDIAKCKDVFPKYANAYEVLSSSENRKNYDYVLANPYEFPSFYMKFSRPKYAPKSDLRFVLVLTLLAAAGVQYLVKHSIYEQAIGAVKKDPRMRYNERVKEIMTRMEKTAAGSPKKGASGSARGEANSAKHNKTKPEDLEKKRKAAEEQLALEFAAELPPPPSFVDNVAVDVFKLPLTVTYTIMWAMSGGMREPGYRTRSALGMSAAEWDGVDEAEREELIGRELWLAENYEAYEEEIAAYEAKQPKTGKEKREQRLRKKQLRNPSAAVIED